MVVLRHNLQGLVVILVMMLQQQVAVVGRGREAVRVDAQVQEHRVQVTPYLLLLPVVAPA